MKIKENPLESLALPLLKYSKYLAFFSCRMQYSAYNMSRDLLIAVDY